MRQRLLVGFILVALFGCSGKPYDVAQVSGKVMLDGKPLDKASITFAPMATKENIAPGPTATGITDAEGRYQMIFDKRTPGAVVGMCRVYITSLVSDDTADDRDGGPPVKRVKDRVPAKYNLNTKLTYDVPAGGSDQADFDLYSQ
jgi:hypothetical protein